MILENDIGLGVGTQLERNRRLLDTITVENGYGCCVVDAVANVKYLTGHVGNPVYESKPATVRQLRYIANLAKTCDLCTAQLEFLAHVYEMDIGQAGVIINHLK